MKSLSRILFVSLFFLVFSSAGKAEDYFVRIYGANPIYYNSIQEAYNAASGSDIIQLRSVWFSEDVICNRSISVTIEGGYNSDFTDNSNDNSILIGSLRAQLGKITTENIIITKIGGIGAEDENPPTGSIIINDGHSYTNSTTVTLKLEAEDLESGIDKMRFSNDGIAWSEPEPYAINKTWTLSSGDGEKTVYVKFSDKAENWSDAYNDTIILDSTPDDTPPEITATVPEENSTYYEEDLIDISAVVNDVDPTPLEYRVYIDGDLVQDWTTQSTYSWTASRGTHLLKIVVWDTGGEDFAEFEICVFRKPIEYSQ